MKSGIYELAINTIQNWSDPNSLYETARIISKDREEKIVSIYYCKNAYKHFGYHFSAQKYVEKST